MNKQSVTLYKQIHPHQCQVLANLGFRSLINLRFDNECDYQPASHDLHQSATKIGLEYRHLPIDGDCLHLDMVKKFAQLLSELPHPVMVFCGTGNRAKLIYQSAAISGLIDGDSIE
ncbi:sulfur transferase domain-containing protein [Moraxella sp. Tifton1]|uniref:beta-lactamase hydrolase domain-containing protein n=1 Tax=Moraxella oculi TaxID=2940516 RepID=UPI002010F5F9|nr:sulfur transferase domain-containing protein [Moraxella sp. Tifton1]MCL1624242.1 sulfur transferase domain-containing protein [Moraxella sp. Tifton1]